MSPSAQSGPSWEALGVMRHDPVTSPGEFWPFGVESR